MIPYASKTTTKRNLAVLRAAGWRMLLSPTGCGLDPVGFRYGLDNGAWTAHQQKKPFDGDLFRAALVKVGPDADWVVVPDIVCGGLESLTVSLQWLPECLRHCSKALIAVQDGFTVDQIEPLVTPRVGLFVGGSTEWKESTMHLWGALAKKHRAWCHVGRVNSARRIRLCGLAGVDSFDGTSVTVFSKTLPRLDNAARQTHWVIHE